MGALRGNTHTHTLTVCMKRKEEDAATGGRRRKEEKGGVALRPLHLASFCFKKKNNKKAPTVSAGANCRCASLPS